jgi:hypothetical protein
MPPDVVIHGFLMAMGGSALDELQHTSEVRVGGRVLRKRKVAEVIGQDG